MTKTQPNAAIINDVLVLYELSLAIGTALDPVANCRGFLSILQARKNISQASVWVESDQLPAANDAPLSLLYANPSRSGGSVHVSGSQHPFARVMESRRPLLVEAGSAEAELMMDGRTFVGGVFILYPLANLGLLELYSTSDAASHPPKSVNQLKSVIDKFANSLVGSLSHYRLQKAEALLKQSENKYRMLVENLPQRFFFKDTNSKYISGSKNYADDLGTSPEALVGKTDYDFFPAHIAEGYQRDDKRIMSSLVTEDIEESIVFDGEERFIHTVKAPALDEHNQVIGVLGMFWDITEEKQAGEQMARLVASVEYAQDAIIISDLDSRMQYVNPAFEKMTGYSAEEAVGQYTKILRSGRHPRSFYVDMLETVRQGNIWRGEMIIKCKDGSFRYVERNVAPVLDEQGDIICQVNIQRDITEHKQMEEQLLQSQKMESLGTLVGGVAHEFNNALAGMTGRLFLLRGKASELPSALHDIDMMEKLCFRSADMVKQMLAFARKSPLQMKDVDLTVFVKETFKLHRLSIPESIDVRTRFRASALPVHGDTTQIQQIVINLLNNARDAVGGEENPEITLELDTFNPDVAFLDVHPDSRGRRYAHLCISDNGCGINQKKLQHIFDPFYTTKEVGKGTGLGLAMVYGACAMHKGYVDVISRSGLGTSMHVYLPLLEERPGTSKATLTQVMGGQGEMILLVDDEEMLRSTGKAVLESLGYIVLEACDGVQAVEIFEAHQHEIRLVLMDVVMPHMGGVEAVKRMQHIRKDVPAIFCTGYDKSDVLADSGVGDEMILSKPYSVEEVSRKIRTCLADAS
ncbi:blue-light-activated protein [Mariprofundus micogutta]|uniref:histidine kinase n=1 Tax=Mariprofundus micogutta TaxID=1921010 RepID=A0A1L8CLY9_9PROT|nr:PAS domain S-box protein [Mariprofundus micogutta]GAV19940.1 blue-light-activated protein [Mariprofundus micogutta]